MPLRCFYCSSVISPPPSNLQSFRCPYCQCRNLYDSRGDIMSCEPAMFDESLNKTSFSKRASPSKDRLPTVYSKGPFCHTCQTNQMLVMNLLANYLPPPDHPEYNRRVESLSQYKESLQSRYPPVCASCLPLVEEEINNKNRMARTAALGGWLKESKGKEKQRRELSTTTEPRIRREMIIWGFRGCLWIATLALAIIGYALGVLGCHFPYPLSTLPSSSLPVIALVSIMWTAWDPTYSSLRKARLQGREVRQIGKKQYITYQLTVWFSRLLTTLLLSLSCSRPDFDPLHLRHYPSSNRSRMYFSVLLILELAVLVGSCTVLRLHRPSPIRLIDTNTHKFSSTRQSPDASIAAHRPSPAPHFPEPDLFAALTLSSKPIISPTNPIFGVPSLLPASHPNGANNAIPSTDSEADADAMDWTPTNPQPSREKRSNASSDGPWLRPQTFFAPERPTGLEGLFERTRLDDTSDHAPRSSSQAANDMQWWKHWWMYAAAAVPVSMLAYAVWQRVLSRQP